MHPLRAPIICDSGDLSYWYFGERGTQLWPGGIDEVRVYNRALSTNEVAALVSAGMVDVK